MSCGSIALDGVFSVSNAYKRGLQVLAGVKISLELFLEEWHPNKSEVFHWAGDKESMPNTRSPTEEGQAIGS